MTTNISLNGGIITHGAVTRIEVRDKSGAAVFVNTDPHYNTLYDAILENISNTPVLTDLVDDDWNSIESNFFMFQLGSGSGEPVNTTRVNNPIMDWRRRNGTFTSTEQFNSSFDIITKMFKNRIVYSEFFNSDVTVREVAYKHIHNDNMSARVVLNSDVSVKGGQTVVVTYEYGYKLPTYDVITPTVNITGISSSVSSAVFIGSTPTITIDNPGINPSTNLPDTALGFFAQRNVLYSGINRKSVGWLSEQDGILTPKNRNKGLMSLCAFSYHDTLYENDGGGTAWSQLDSNGQDTTFVINPNGSKVLCFRPINKSGEGGTLSITFKKPATTDTTFNMDRVRSLWVFGYQILFDSAFSIPSTMDIVITASITWGIQI